jgi:hypothetical protein
MKKILNTLLIAAAINFCHAQGVTFKIAYKPNHSYQMNGNLNMTINTDLSSVPQIASALTAQGINEPINAQADMQLQSNITTGHAAAGSMPFNLNFNLAGMTVNVNGKPIPIPMNPSMGNIKMAGHINDGFKLSVDSMNSKKVPDSVAAKTMSMMNNMYKMINFPDHPLKPGESFTQQIPFNLPMGKDMNINVKVTYTLVSIEGTKANFNLVQDMNMQMNMQGKANVTFTGGGTGKMVYDIANNFFSSYESNAAIKINVKADKMDINANMNVKSNMSYLISDSK